MKRTRYLKGIPYVVAAVVFVCLLLFTFRVRPDKTERLQVQAVAFGDSVFGLFQNDSAIPAQLERLLGKSIFNAAFGGTCVSRMNEEGSLSDFQDALSLVGIARAVRADDFGVQQSLSFRESNTQYFENTVDVLEQIDFSSVELVIIQDGLNDYYSGVALENRDDPYDEYTFAGALRSTVGYLRAANPKMRLVLVTPTYSWYVPKELTCEEYDGGGGLLEDYVRVETEIAEELGVELVDVYHNVYPHEKWEDWRLYTWDGLHPNEEGRALLANVIAEAIQW